MPYRFVVGTLARDFAHAVESKGRSAWANAREISHVSTLRQARLPTLLQGPLAGVETRQHALLAQFVERERDLAAVLAAKEVHDLREILGAAFERLPRGLVARRRVADAARKGAAVLDRIGLADRLCQIEAEL